MEQIAFIVPNPTRDGQLTKKRISHKETCLLRHAKDVQYRRNTNDV